MVLASLKSLYFPVSHMMGNIKFAISVLLLLTRINLALSEQEPNFLQLGCSLYNASNLWNFYSNFNSTMIDIRTQLLDENKHFVMVQRPGSADPVYGMCQCRNYLSSRDCVACFDVAVSMIRSNCSACVWSWFPTATSLATRRVLIDVKCPCVWSVMRMGFMCYLSVLLHVRFGQ